MGKRFGRRQKRKLKQELANKVLQLSSAEKLNKSLQNNTEDLLFIVNDLREAFGKDSSFVPVENQYLLEQPLTYWDIEDSCDITLCSSYENITHKKPMQVMRKLLYNLTMDVKENPLQYDGTIHFRFYLDQGTNNVSQAGYTMSEDMLYKMDRVQLERRIGKEVAELIVKGVRR